MNVSARILPIRSVSDVPKADRLSVMTVLGYQAVVAKNPDGSHAFAAGDRVVYVPEGMTVPEAMLRELGFWGPNPETGVVQGTLAGPRGDLIRPMTLRKQLSTGLILPLPEALSDLTDGTDVSAHYGLVEWIPVVPDAILRIAMPLYEAKNDYVIPRLKTYPGFFAADEIVSVTEKLHGENVQLTWLGGRIVDGLHHGGRIAIATKGMARSGYAFRDVEDAARVPVVRAVARSGLLAAFAILVQRLGAQDGTVRLYAEAIGGGVQKMHYGEPTPSTRAIDVRVGNEWLDEDAKAAALADAGIARVPVLYRGPFDPDAIDAMREGRTSMDDKHDREGVVVTAVGDQSRRMTDLGDSIRPSLKYHSDRFLRKFGIED